MSPMSVVLLPGGSLKPAMEKHTASAAALKPLAVLAAQPAAWGGLQRRSSELVASVSLLIPVIGEKAIRLPPFSAPRGYKVATRSATLVLSATTGVARTTRDSTQVTSMI